MFCAGTRWSTRAGREFHPPASPVETGGYSVDGRRRHMIAAMNTTQPMPLANDTEEGRAVACARSNPTELTPWVLAAAAGDTRAFGHLVEATSGLVTAIALAISRDAEQSKDLAQEVFVAA